MMKFFIALIVLSSYNSFSQEKGHLTYKEVFQDTTRIILTEENNTYQPDYVVTIKHDRNFSDALNAIKNEPQKFLIVVYDTPDTETYNNYLHYVGNYILETQRHMYYGYEKEFDRFEFCFIKNNDATYSNPYFNNTIKNGIAYYNASGDCLYYLARPIADEKEFYEWNSLYQDITNANKLVTCDKLFTAENATIKDLKKAFLTASEINHWETDDFVMADEETEKKLNYYNYLDEAEQGYQLKASKELVIQRWKHTIEILAKESTLDNRMISVIINELSRQGFSKALFNESSKLLREDDFVALDYLLSNYIEIATKTSADYDYLYMNEHSLIYSIMVPLRETMDKDNQPSNELVKKAISYFYKLMAYYEENTLIESYFIYSLSFTNETEEYLKNYDHYFAKYANNSSNLITNLDKYYNLEKESNDALVWENYKSEFIDLANISANFVLNHSKEKEKIQKAIYWLETCLPIDEKKYESLATLSKLYYFHNEKEKALAMAVKAIDYAKKETVDEDLLAELVQNKKKIKENTY